MAVPSRQRDDILEMYVPRWGPDLLRGPEEDVLERYAMAASAYDADVIVRITADAPLVPPPLIDMVVARLQDTGADFAATVIERTFPRGLTVEAFTRESFRIVNRRAKDAYQREHVTPYYKENPDIFQLENVSSAEFFDHERFVNRTDLRLTVDEAADYELMKTTFEGLQPEEILPVTEAIDYVDENGLAEINSHVKQKPLNDTSENESNR